MSADFTPIMHGYTGQGAFKFWCQKVLPLVYDDSLSYYELLCKVVNYLNNVISDVSATESNVQSLYDSFVALQNYVNEYFNNLDVTEAVHDNVNAEFNEYVESDTFKALVDEYVNDYLSEYAEQLVDESVGLKIDDSVAGQIDDVVAEQLPDAIGEDVSELTPSIVTQWLNDNVTPVGSAVTVDKSLSIEDSAADAKVTGEWIKRLNDATEFEEIDNHSPTLHQGGFASQTGSATGSSARVRSAQNNGLDFKNDKVVIDSGYSITFYGKNSVGEWLGNWNGSEFTITNTLTWYTEYDLSIIKASGVTNIVFALSKGENHDEELTPSVDANVHFIEYKYNIKDTIERNSDNINKIELSKIDYRSYTNNYYINLTDNYNFEKGFIKKDDGADSTPTSETSRRFIRINGYIIDTVECIKYYNGFIIYRYNSNNEYVDSFGDVDDRLYEYNDFDYTTYKYRIAIRRNLDDEDIQKYINELLMMKEEIYDNRYCVDTYKFIPPYGWYTPINEDFAENFTYNSNYNYLIDKIMSLIDSSNNYLTIEQFGTDSDDLPLYVVKTHSCSFDTSRVSSKKPLIFINSGIQGTERSNIYGIYYLFKHLCNNENNILLNYLYDYVDFMWVPCLSPWGFNHKVYYNKNRVSLNRNFDCDGWTPTDPSDPEQYTGEEPFDQPETAAVRDLILANNKPFYLIDSHTYGTGVVSTLARMNWQSLPGININEYRLNSFTACTRHIIGWTRELYKEYNIGDGITPCGMYTSAYQGNGTFSAWCSTKSFINANTCEGFNGFYGSSETYTNDVYKGNEDLITNWILNLLREYLK